MRSIVGGFLEHSRIFRFGADPTRATYLIGSADLMPRNLDRRVESLCPVESPALRGRLDEILTVCLADDVLAWELAGGRRVAQGRDDRRLRRPGAAPGAGRRAGAAAVVTVIEREIKLAAPPARALPPLSDPLAGVVAEPQSTQLLLAIYYDTDDLRLTRAGASLRHRNDEGWAVKLPRRGTVDGRLDRATYAFHGDDGTPPTEALELVRALARSASVRPVARLRTTRRAVRLHTTAGVPIGEVVDDDVTVLGPEGSVTGFRELEFELADDAPEAHAASIVARLRASGAGPPDPTPKIVRALGPRAADPPDVRGPADEAHTVGEIVCAALGRTDRAPRRARPRRAPRRRPRGRPPGAGRHPAAPVPSAHLQPPGRRDVGRGAPRRARLARGRPRRGPGRRRAPRAARGPRGAAAPARIGAPRTGSSTGCAASGTRPAPSC